MNLLCKLYFKIMCIPIIRSALLDRKLMDLFRGVMRVGDKSSRVLNLTEAILDINAANYTVW